MAQGKKSGGSGGKKSGGSGGKKSGGSGGKKMTGVMRTGKKSVAAGNNPIPPKKKGKS